MHTQPITSIRRSHSFRHYENTPIQIYWKFYHQKKMKIFQIKVLLIFFMFLLKKHRLWILVRTVSAVLFLHDLKRWCHGPRIGTSGHDAFIQHRINIASTFASTLLSKLYNFKSIWGLVRTTRWRGQLDVLMLGANREKAMHRAVLVINRPVLLTIPQNRHEIIVLISK